jgi:hypothetical protein
MVDKAPSKRSLQNVWAELGDRKIVLLGPNNEKLQDTRYAVHDAGVDHVVIKLLGDELLVIPYSAMRSVKVERTVVTVKYG